VNFRALKDTLEKKAAPGLAGSICLTLHLDQFTYNQVIDRTESGEKIDESGTA
jgi:hypothetical protein